MRRTALALALTAAVIVPVASTTTPALADSHSIGSSVLPAPGASSPPTSGTPTRVVTPQARRD